MKSPEKKEKNKGRPKWHPPLGAAEKVEVLTACGWKPKDIAIVFEVSEPTLKQTFYKELNEGLLKQKAEALMKLKNSGFGGNTSALKEYIEKMEATLAPSFAQPTAPKIKEPKLGKKEVEQREAESAHQDSDWGKLLHKDGSALPN